MNNINNNVLIEKALEELPEKVSEALIEWRKATLEKEKCEALLLLRFRVEYPEDKGAELKARVHCDLWRYDMALNEAKAEAKYNLIYEKLMAAKKIASLRTAF